MTMRCSRCDIAHEETSRCPTDLEYERGYRAGLDQAKITIAEREKHLSAAECSNVSLRQRLAAAEAALHGQSSECVYCRNTLGVGEEDANHWETCEKHPARQRLAAAEARESTLRGLLREACGSAYDQCLYVDKDWYKRAKAALERKP